MEFKPPLCTLQAVWPRARHMACLGLSLPTQNAWVVMRPRLLCGKKGSTHRRAPWKQVEYCHDN